MSDLPNDFGKKIGRQAMGGMGSGRRYGFGKNSTDDYLKLDVRHLQRGGWLAPERSSRQTWRRNGEVVGYINLLPNENSLRLIYQHRKPGREWIAEDYAVRLSWTPCHYGGRRAWFICPAQGCGKRVAILYGGATFVCRKCHQLTYPCQNERAYDRRARRADKIRDRLGWEPGGLNGRGIKPKGMHQKTFKRLTWQHDGLVQASLAGMMQRFDIKGAVLKAWA